MSDDARVPGAPPGEDALSSGSVAPPSAFWLRWTRAIERRRRWILGGALLVTIACALSLFRLELDIDVVDMLPHGEPAFDDFRTFVGDFGQLDEMVVLIDGGTAAERESFASELAERLRKLPSMTRVDARIDSDSLLQGLLGRWLFHLIDERDHAELARRLSPEGIAAQVATDRAILAAPFDLAAARLLADDPLALRQLAARRLRDNSGDAGSATGSGWFASTDGSALLLLARPARPPFDGAFSTRLLQDVHRAAHETRAANGAAQIRIAITGAHAFAVEHAAALRADVRRYTILALLAVLTIFAIGFRSLRATLFVAPPVVLATLGTFALSLLLFDSLDAISLSFAAILYGLSIDSGVLFHARLSRERAERGDDLRGAIAATLGGLALPDVVGNLTTAVAFLVIGLSSLTAVRQLGILTAVGMAITALQFFIVYPALGYALAGILGPPRPIDARRLEALARTAERRATRLRIGAACAAAALALLASQVRLDPSLDRLQPSGSEAARVREEVQRRFAPRADEGAVLVRRAELQDALSDAERVAAALRELESQGTLRSVRSVDAILPSAATQRRRLESQASLPRARAAADLRRELRAQGFVTDRFENAIAALAQPRDKSVLELGDPALEPAALVVDRHVRSRPGDSIVGVFFSPAAGSSWSQVDALLRGKLGTLDVAIAARGLLEERLGQILHHELPLFALLGLAGNAIVLLASFRRPTLALALLLPTVLALLSMLALMAVARIPLDPVNLIVVPLVFGIGVDYAVYFVAAAQERRDLGSGVRMAGRPVVIAALTTIAGFGFLSMSSYPPLAMMGFLTTWALLATLILCLTILPALLPRDALEAPARSAANVDDPPRTAPRA